MLGLRPALNQPPPLASPAHTFAILIICLPLKAIQGATSSYVSTFDVDCDGDGDGGSDCMRDGAYKFCALFIFLFLFFFFLSGLGTFAPLRVACNLGSSISSSYNYKTHLAGQQQRRRRSVKGGCFSTKRRDSEPAQWRP